MLKHDVTRIGRLHPNGAEREVAVYIDGRYYARDPIATALRAIRGGTNDVLVAALARNAVRYAIDDRSYYASTDSRHLCFGQDVTLDELKDIASRDTTPAIEIAVPE